MIPETLALWIAVGGNAVLAAKLLAFRFKDPLPVLPPRLPDRFPDRKLTEIKEQPKTAIHSQLYSTPPRLPEIERPIAARVVTPDKAAQLLIRYLQDSKCTGVFAASEIDAFWDMARDHLNLFHIPYGTIRSQLQGIPGVYLDRQSLSIDYREVCQRTGMKRAVLYRIPDRGRSAARTPSHNQTIPVDDLPVASQRPASDEKPNHIKRAA